MGGKERHDRHADKGAAASAPVHPEREVDGERFMQIGEVSQRTGLTQRALRYYESLGLLQPPSRMDGGFRLYSEQDVGRLDRIVELKKLLGYSLAEIRQVIEADELLRQIKTENKRQPDARARRAGLERAVDVIVNQLALVRSRIEAMRELQAHYERRLERLRGRIASIDESLATPTASRAGAATDAGAASRRDLHDRVRQPA